MIVERRAHAFRPDSVGGRMHEYEREGMSIHAHLGWRSFFGEVIALGAVPTQTILNPAPFSPHPVMGRA